jgi:hypothetical protein
MRGPATPKTFLGAPSNRLLARGHGAILQGCASIPPSFYTARQQGFAMETNLRPLTLGEILDRTAQLYRSHFWLFAGIASVYSGTLLLLNLAQIGVTEYLRAHHLPSYLAVAAGVGITVQFFVAFVVGGLAVAANNRAVGWVHLGEPATIRGSYSSILPRAGRYVWLMTIILLVLWTPMLLSYGGYAAAMYHWVGHASMSALQTGTTAPNQQAVLTALLVTACFGLVALVALAYAVVMGLRYALAIPACVVEDLKARGAIRRSIDLSKGSRGRIFVLGLLVVIIQLGLVGITQVAFIVLSLKAHGELTAGVRVIQQLVAFVTNTFIGPMYATGLTLFYYDQRVRKEGYDIEWMMQAAGMMPSAATPEPVSTLDPPANLGSEKQEPDQPEHA